MIAGADLRARPVAIAGAVLLLVGALVSGPIAVAIVGVVHPQPAWQGAARFAAEAHPIQIVPYLAGLVLVAGFVLVIAALHAMAPGALRVRTTAATAFVAVYAAMVGINYAIQTTFVPALAARYTDADAPILGAFTMSNPTSLGWALEMWGYGFSGVATWLVAPVFVSGSRGRAAALAFRANGAISVIGALATAAWPGWVMTPPGLVAFAGWNLLVAAMIVLALIELRASPTDRDGTMAAPP